MAEDKENAGAGTSTSVDQPTHLANGKFAPGNRANPKGRPMGSKHKATLAAAALMDGEAEALSRKAIEMAKAGDSVALRLCLERILPPRRESPLEFELPKLTSLSTAIEAHGCIAEAVANGDLTAGEAADVSKIVDNFARAFEANELAVRVDELERRMMGDGK